MGGGPRQEPAAKPPPVGPAVPGTWVYPDEESAIMGKHFGTLPSDQDVRENEGCCCDPPLSTLGDNQPQNTNRKIMEKQEHRQVWVPQGLLSQWAEFPVSWEPGWAFPTGLGC